MKGPKPKPAEVKRKTGSKHQTQTVLVGGRQAPRMPAQLSPRAKTAWRQLVSDMEGAGILDKADWPLIEVTANLIANYRHAVEMGNREGIVCEGQKGNPTTSPWFRISMETGKEIRQLLEHLGIGPVGRSRLGMAGGKAKKSLSSEMADRIGPSEGLKLVKGGKG